MTLLMESVSSAVFGPKQYTPFEPVFESDSKELIMEIKRMIRRETNRGVQEMRVTLEDGKVVLYGYCRTFYTKQLAQQAAMKVLGADELVNEIRVA